MAQPAAAAEIKVLTAGAFKQVLLEAVPAFEKETGHKVIVDNDTVGALQKRIDGGEAFDVLVLSPRHRGPIIKAARSSRASNVQARQGRRRRHGQEGAPKPDIGSVEAFKQTLLAASRSANIDPASGGSSGIYVAGLFAKLGIADQIKPKAQAAEGRSRARPGQTAKPKSASTRSARSSGEGRHVLVGPAGGKSRTTRPMRWASVPAPRIEAAKASHQKS